MSRTKLAYAIHGSFAKRANAAGASRLQKGLAATGLLGAAGLANKARNKINFLEDALNTTKSNLRAVEGYAEADKQRLSRQLKDTIGEKDRRIADLNSTISGKKDAIEDLTRSLEAQKNLTYKLDHQSEKTLRFLQRKDVPFEEKIRVLTYMKADKPLRDAGEYSHFDPNAIYDANADIPGGFTSLLAHHWSPDRSLLNPTIP